jgi:hypothetical protein
MKHGSSYLGGWRGVYSAAWAYRQVYGRHRPLKPNSARSAASRLARQPWMKAARTLDQRLIARGGRKTWPEDLRSHHKEWLYIIARLRETSGFDWSREVAHIIREARTAAHAAHGLLTLPALSQDEGLAMIREC